MKVDLRTEGQKTRDARNEAICKSYKDIRTNQPLVTKNRVLVAVAGEFGLVTQTVKDILRKNEAYI